MSPFRCKYCELKYCQILSAHTLECHGRVVWGDIHQHYHHKALGRRECHPSVVSIANLSIVKSYQLTHWNAMVEWFGVIFISIIIIRLKQSPVSGLQHVTSARSSHI